MNQRANEFPYHWPGGTLGSIALFETMMASNFRILAISIFLLSIAPLGDLAWADPTTKTAESPPATAVDKTSTAYLTATVPRQWAFPRDHGRHEGFKTEWWYFAGNVADQNGRKFGYQLTFFRASISPIYVPQISPWLIGDQYFAHAAVTDLAAGQFHFRDRMAHAQKGVVGSANDTLHVALSDWSVKLQSDGAILLSAADPAFGINLTCQPGVGPVLQGPDGINRKGKERSQASYYYSMTRLPTSGTLAVGGQTFHVTGQTWMDHEFSSNALGPDQVGWDWVGLTLANGDDLMVYRLRNRAGGSDFLSGTLIDAAGHPKYLTDRDIAFQGSAPWKSESGAAYPQSWSLAVAGLPAMTVRSRMPGQELRTEATIQIDYFEGSCEVVDAAGKPAGEGYLEMTGYAKPITQP